MPVHMTSVKEEERKESNRHLQSYNRALSTQEVSDQLISGM